MADTEQHEKAGEKSSEKRTLISRDHYETTEKVWPTRAARAAMDVNRYNVATVDPRPSMISVFR